jgi:hypothetical protein
MLRRIANRPRAIGIFNMTRNSRTSLLALLSAGSLALLAAGASHSSSPAAPARAGSGPVLLELFTSQGCSSCPPADALAERLAREPGVVVITRAVTYWDRLGWKDTLGSAVNTRLQQDYDAHRLPDGGVFTPELVVDGQGAAVGSDEPAIRRLIGQAAARGKPVIAQASAKGGGLAIGIAGQPQAAVEVVLVALTGKVTVAVGSGENGGRRLTFTNVYRGERVLGQWRGGTASFPVAASLLHVMQADRYAVIVRRPGGGSVLAVRLLGPAGARSAL